MLDTLYETNETQFADRIEHGLSATFNLLHKVLDNIPANEAAQRAFAASYLEGEGPDGGKRTHHDR